MVKYGYITQAQADAAKAKPLGVVPLQPRERRAAYFLEYIERQLAGKFQRQELDTSGLRIYTTLDNDVQAAAEAMLTQMRPGKEDATGVVQPQVAVVALDPANGYIKAMIGGRDYGNTQLNRADRAYRQPASAIKPFVYTTAIDSREFTPSTILMDEPVTFRNADGTTYAPRNYDGKFRGPITLQEALEQSVNVIAIKLVERLGPSRVASYGRKMGLSEPGALRRAQRSQPGLPGPGRADARRHPAGTGRRLFATGKPRDQGGATGDPQGDRPSRQRALRTPAQPPRGPERGHRLRHDQYAAPGRDQRHGPQRLYRRLSPGGRQDRHRDKQRQRLVCRLYARTCWPRSGSATIGRISRCLLAAARRPASGGSSCATPPPSCRRRALPPRPA